MNRTHLDPSPMPQPLLTVIVPVYNEGPTVERILQRILDAPYPYKEIIVVDDSSQDGTVTVLKRWANHENILVLRHPRNRGKGAAVRTGLARARGAFTLIQDADLEYDPADYPQLVEALQLSGHVAVYGSRFLRPTQPLPWSKFRCAVTLLNHLVRLLYGQHLTDEATCYKLLPTDLFRALNLQAQRFELCAEMTAKLCRLGVPIIEIAIRYAPRGYQEGKKIGWSDAAITLWTLLRWRLDRFPQCRTSQPVLRPASAMPAEAR